MTIINFLGADVPLTKRMHADGTKDAYPLVKNFTSYEEKIETVEQLFKSIIFHADQGHCLLKGQLTRPLTAEPRAGTTRTDDATEWVCLDFDRHECANIEDVLTSFGLGDISYVIQYSSSHGMPDNEGTVSAHVFMLLDKPLPAPRLKAWLMSLNLDHLKEDLRLSRAKSVISWPLDVTTCQNDKLLYIAPPSFVKMKDPVKTRIKLVKGRYPKLRIQLIGERNINTLKVDERKCLNILRESEGLPKRTAKTSWVGSIEVQNKPDVCEVTESREQGEYIRLNLNGGDSWAYWHHRDNFELIHDFKSDTWYKTKELVPGYYQGLIEARQALNATPTENGDVILAFRDMKSAEYYNGLYNIETQRLDLHRAKNETQLDHWMRSHGRTIGDFIPVWDICYDPRADWVIDEDRHRINLFKKTKYMRMEPKSGHTPLKSFPNIYRVIRHFLGEDPNDTKLSAHFLNWFACIFQRNEKPITAWVIHGTEGTGKGYFMKHIVTPLFGLQSIMEVGIQNIEDNFNGFLEGKLFINVNEIDVDDFTEKGRVSAKFKTLITDSTMPIRRMRQVATQEPNFASFLFASNKRQPVQIPADDRRYNVGNRQLEKIVPPKDEDVANELEKFAEWLLDHKADVKLAGTILQTEAREAIQKLGVSSIQETCDAMVQGDLEKLWMTMTDEALLNRATIQTAHTANAMAYNTLLRHIASQALATTKSTLSRDEMAIILQYNVGNIRPEPNRITSLLRHNGIETKQVRHNGKKTYGIHVDWKISDEFRKELIDEFQPKSKLRKIKG